MADTRRVAEQYASPAAENDPDVSVPEMKQYMTGQWPQIVISLSVTCVPGRYDWTVKSVLRQLTSSYLLGHTRALPIPASDYRVSFMTFSICLSRLSLFQTLLCCRHQSTFSRTQILRA
jgi:hypothetical protein